MDLLTVSILALGLSMDSFAVSISCGLAEQKISFQHAVKIALSLAFFQGLLPLLGWFVGSEIKYFVEHFDHWIAFALLSYLGGRMMFESLDKENTQGMANVYSWQNILTLSIATSIDAMIVGFSYALASPGDLLWGAVIIGAVTFFFSMLGIRIGKDVGNRFGKRMELLGGIVLLAIGFKILLEHFFS